MSDHPIDARLLFANSAFYAAFSCGDLDALDALWARRAPVCCIHPGWPMLTSREQIMASWQRILDNPEAPSIQPHHASVVHWGETHAVLCYEALGGQMLTAVNLFVLEDEELRLVHHQSGQCAQPPAPETTRPTVQ